MLAHADLLATDPPDKAVVSDPIPLVTLTFSEGIEPTGEGFRLLEPDGSAVSATVFQPEATVVIIEPESPLEDGRYVVIWKAQSADSHVLSGSFSFTIEGVGSDSTEEDSTTGTPAEDGSQPSTTAPTVTVPTTVPNRVEAAPSPIRDAIPPPVALETEQDESLLAGAIGDLGRWVTMAGALLAVGAFAFAATALIGTPDEVRRSILWVRRGSILVIGGTLLEVVAVSIATSAASASALSPTHIVDAIGVQFGIAVVLRLVGAIALLQDPRSLVVSQGRPVLDMSRSPNSDADPNVDDRRVAGSTVVDALRRYRIEVQHEWVMMAGMAAVVASFALDGHSVEIGAIGRAASIVHVVAAGVWFGGLVVMADTLMRRWRAGVAADAAFMAIRFSRVAAASLGLAAIAGVVLAWTIADAPSDIVTTTWGRLLLIKVALVGVVTAIGAYNHFRVVPGISDDATDQKAAILRRTTRVEAAILVAVLGVTAMLVAAAV